jgi:uncharacterized membrane protein YkoI
MRILFATAFLAALAIPARAEEKSDLAGRMSEAKVPLERGIAASKVTGTPISAKYEVEDGKLQLAVYTAKGDSFSEVIVDHKTGKVAKSDPITSGDDLTAAKAQNEAVSQGKTPLDAAVAKAVKANKGYQAVSAMPSVKDGRPMVEITLLKGTSSKKVSHPLN